VAELADRLELFRAVVARVTSTREPTPRVPTRIFAFADASGYAPFRPEPSVVGFLEPKLRANVVAILADPRRGASSTHVLLHEYTHVLTTNENAAVYPLWYEEGIADLLSTTQEDGDAVVVGRAPPGSVATVLRDGALPMSSVVGLRAYPSWGCSALGDFYGRSWLLVHYLSFGEGYASSRQTERVSSRVARMQRDVETGTDPETAFASAFALDPDRLQGVLEDYIGEGTIPVLRLARKDFTPLPHSSRSLAAAEVATELGHLALAVGKEDEARRRFEAALALDEGRARAHAGLGTLRAGEGRCDEAEARFARALALDPDDFENHLDRGEAALACAAAQPARARELVALARSELERAIALAPENPEAHAALGWSHVVVPGDAAAGLAAAKRAEALLPAHPETQILIAWLHLQQGDRDRARGIAQRLAALGHGPEGERNALLDAIERADAAAVHAR